ncbi:hypothetical protein PR048_005775 [Dryococelus australis]|uniref:Uncharacterized protein n=1 Tax=Dryococelus australis TaxID=614101 RepID=A0ABQ9I944_9NEOP|nr:hypothetical protein PR048_005775 [Dryococelus australis]
MCLKIPKFHPHLQATEHHQVQPSSVVDQVHRRQQNGMCLKIPQFYPHLQVTEDHRVLSSSVLYQARHKSERKSGVSAVITSSPYKESMVICRSHTKRPPFETMKKRRRMQKRTKRTQIISDSSNDDLSVYVESDSDVFIIPPGQ